MRSFSHIHFFCNDSRIRTIEELSAVYADHDLLMEAIIEITGDTISEKRIKNKKILLKPNWVSHPRIPQDELCLRTHDDFVIAVLKLVLKKNPLSILIGDSPIQGCKWEKMISDTFKNQVYKLSEEFSIPIEIADFRRRKYTVAKNKRSVYEKDLIDFIIFDIGEESMLEPLTTPGKSKFRVTNYDPERMSEAHASGIHNYCIIKEFFEADVVISIPKVKTHQKTGITGAVKNLVGINGDKDFLPHHRIGGTKYGGDCYPGGSYLRFWSEHLLDKANRREGEMSFWLWQKLSSLLWRLSLPGPEHQLEAGWYGNDTAWRMVLDINKIALYGKADGTLSNEPQRQIYSLCDGIIAGQGDGPLNTSPLPLGIISFTNDSLLNDQVMAILMGLPVDKIPLLNQDSNWKDTQSEITMDGEAVTFEDLKKYAIKATPPRGWVEYFNK